MLPVVAIVGRSNVGKSTLFNCLTQAKNALVVDKPGTTRDRQYGRADISEQKSCIVIDTGGVDYNEVELDDAVASQIKQAISECSLILYVIDSKQELANDDLQLAKKLRKLPQPKLLLLNKSAGLDEQLLAADYYSLGLGQPICIDALSGRSISRVRAELEQQLDGYVNEQEEQTLAPDSKKVAIVGQPNVGKSTLLNLLAGESRVVVSDLPGTTRDSIYVDVVNRQEHYTFIDTAGIRRKSRVRESVEKFSIVRSLQAIEEADVVLLLIDASANLNEQDLKLLGYVAQAGRALVVAVNKWDLLDASEKLKLKDRLKHRLQFVDYAIFNFISALRGLGCSGLYRSIDSAYLSATTKVSTPKLSNLLNNIVAKHQPPMVSGRRIRLKYAHAGGNNPVRVIIHGTQTDMVPDNYKRYLAKSFRQALKLHGAPVFIDLKVGDNPYSGKKNILTPRQQRKRKRLLSHHRKSGK